MGAAFNPPAGLLKDRTRLHYRAQTSNIPVLKRQTKARRTLVERQLQELDAEIAALIRAQESTARSCQILLSMPGVGAVSVAALVTLMPEIGTLDRKQVAILTG
jgi:transposase